ncbi:hypothetical protein ABVK33_10045 [Mycobacterium kansasii]|uniref:hypothetical protein n=1 Tax=Mycobacterium kansasii TaxID=1768 RepID=UPI000F018C26|nr:hypothetical protein [Mycobacterium kansasii]VAZ65316.1 hypothetical protein LAUMK40_01441 [Mycobacterium kansasii]
MNGDQLASLLSALGNIPSLPGALCRGHPEIWAEPPPPQSDPDPADTAERLSFALSACCRCPALAVCRAWYEQLPPRKRPQGVIAGRVR